MREATMIMIEKQDGTIKNNDGAINYQIQASYIWGCSEIVFLKRLAMMHGDVWRERFPNLKWQDYPQAYKAVICGDVGGQFAERLKQITLTKEKCLEARRLPPTV